MRSPARPTSWARRATTGRPRTTPPTPPTASAPRWAWPSTTARSTRSGPATSTRPRSSTAPPPAMPCPSTTGRWSSRRARGSSTAPWGRSRYAEAASGAGHASPSPSTGRSTRPATTASFTPADVQVFYHDTTFGDPSIPLDVLSVTPVALQRRRPRTTSSATPSSRSPSTSTSQPGGGPSGIANYTGTYSYLIAPDDGNGNPIVEPIASYVITDVAQPVIGPVASTDVPLRIPTTGTGGTGTAGRHHDLDAHRRAATTTRSSPGSRSTCR